MSPNTNRKLPSRRDTLKVMGTTLMAAGVGTTTSAASSDDTEPTQKASLTFADQSPHYGTVYVTDVTLPEDGFIALHDASFFTEGPVIGVSPPLAKGTYSKLPVEFYEYPDGPLTVAAMAHQDTPSDGVFTYPDDGDQPFFNDGTAVHDTAWISPD
jgi:hypothetical protein